MRTSHGLALAASAVAFAILAPLAGADAVYHSEHLGLTPVGDAPLRSGFVENIKTQGPVNYAHEVFVLNGAAPNTTYTVTRRFFGAPGCAGGFGADEVGEIKTNGAGNGHDDAVVPAGVIPPSAAGDYGVLWIVTDASGSVRYDTDCTKVTLD